MLQYRFDELDADTIAPEGYISFFEAFNQLGKLIFKKEWHGEEEVIVGGSIQARDPSEDMSSASREMIEAVKMHQIVTGDDQIEITDDVSVVRVFGTKGGVN